MLHKGNNKTKKRKIKVLVAGENRKINTTNVYQICDISQHVSYPAIYIVSQSTIIVTTIVTAVLAHQKQKQKTKRGGKY